jgi:hypothetical protein
LLNLKIKTMKSNSCIIIHILLAALIMLSLPIGISAQNSASTDLKIKKLLSAYHDQDRFNGVVLVAKNGEKMVSEGYGKANLEWNIPNSPEVSRFSPRENGCSRGRSGWKIPAGGIRRPDHRSDNRAGDSGEGIPSHLPGTV